MKNSIYKIALSSLLLICTAADAATAHWIFNTHGAALIWPISVHILLCLLFVSLLYLHQKSGDAMNFNFLLIASVVACIFPAYGMAGLTIIYFLNFKRTDDEQDYFEFDDSTVPDSLDELIALLDEDIVGFIRAEQNIDALKDIFLSGDQQLEETAIQKLSKLGTKSAVTILRSVVEQSTTDVKILAASALTGIEEKTVSEIDRLQKAIEAEPATQDHLLELARTFDLYCHLGVLDSSLLAYYQNLGIEKYQQYCQAVPGDSRAKTELGRLLLKTGRIDEAKSVFAQLIEAAPEDFNPKIWLAETYYAGGDYARVREICRDIQSCGDVPDICVDTISWWTGDQFQDGDDIELEAGVVQNEF